MSNQTTKFTAEEGEKLMKLTLLDLTKEEQEKIAEQLGSALENFQVLKELSGGQMDFSRETFYLAENYFAEDVVIEATDEEKEKIRQNFSARTGNYLNVTAMFN